MFFLTEALEHLRQWHGGANADSQEFQQLSWLGGGTQAAGEHPECVK